MNARPDRPSSPRRGRRGALLPVLGLAIVSALPLVSSAASSWRERQVSQASARSFVTGFVGDPVAGDLLRPADRGFLTRAANAGRDGVKLADLAANRAERAEVRSLARQMQGDYRVLSETAEALSRRKGGPPSVSDPLRTEAVPAWSGRAGAAVEREVVQALAHLSDQTLSAFEQATSEARDSDVRDFAAAQLPVLRAHRTALTEVKRMLE